MKRIISTTALVFLLLPPLFYGYGQQPSMKILDTLLTYNPSKNDVVKLNVEVQMPHFDSDTLFLYGFTKLVESHSFLIDALELGCKGAEDVGLQFVVEDSLGEMQRIQGVRLVSRTFWSCEKRRQKKEAMTRRFVDERTGKLYYKKLDTNQLIEYDRNMPVLPMTGTLEVVTLYPILLDNLAHGKYKIYLYYSVINPKSDSSSKQFFGTIVSNKVDLIVEK